jgi:hypothetical protein
MSYVGLGDSNINPTTIWTQATGFLSVAGDPSTGATQPTFVAPVQNPAPACSSGPAATADSAACIAQLLSNQQQNMNNQNAANYNYDLQTCEANYAENVPQYQADGITPPQDTCSENTFGLTPTVSGGYTGTTPVPTVTCPLGQSNVNGVCTANYVAPPPPSGGSGTGTGAGSGTGSGGGSGTGGGGTGTGNGNGSNISTDPNGAVCATTALVSGYCPSGMSFFTQDVNILGEEIPVWGLIAAGVAALVLLPSLIGGRR